MTNPLTNKNRVLIGSYVHVPNFLNFDMDDMVSCDTKYFFPLVTYRAMWAL